MNKKILVLLAIIIIAILAIAAIAIKQKRAAQNSEITKEELQQKFQSLKSQYDAAKAQGVDVSEVEGLGLEAKQAFDNKDYKKAGDLLDTAQTALNKAVIPAKTPISPSPIILPAPSPKSSPAPIGKTWLNEGAIYETHPYYYPNHSFKEITEQIPHLKELGVKTIYLMPIWERAMKRQETTLIYLINDYYKIDPAYGSPDDLKELIDIVHKNDMKILFDLVTCCTPPNSIIYNNNWTYSFSSTELAEKAKEMNWKLEYTTLDGRNFVFAGKHKSSVAGGKDLYEFGGEISGDRIMVRSFPIAGWGPAVDLGNANVIKYFTQIAEYYVKEYGIDGWRIDAPSNNYNSMVFSGDHSSEKLLISAIGAVKKIKPDAAFISEPGLSKKVPAELEYANLPRLMPGIAANTITSQQLIDKLAQGIATLGKTPLLVLESHDQSRLNKDNSTLNKNFLVMISTLPGIPFIQAGQEIGATNDWFRTGNADPKVNWINGDYGLRDFYKKVFSIRNSSSALKYGDIKNVWKSGDNIYAYSRAYENETVIVVINFNGKQVESVLDIPFPNGTRLKDELNGEIFTVSDSANFKITVPAYGSRILTVK
ncbi:MAG: alpha-glucosidase C-terminal domain-containing protein [Nanoarchaeota archaeon]|nr:alpha-glucosidase C-terminal domain-containing protein [Nanoarchaeota archaeon]